MIHTSTIGSNTSIRLLAYLKLMRPANLVTAIADILAGFAICKATSVGMPFGIFTSEALFWLILSTIGLYGGGVVFNDVFDVKIDRIERPERPIPSGKSTIKGAALLGFGLFSAGIFSALMVSILSFSIAIAIMLFALIYNRYSKHHPIFGPINMGLCRGLNLMLGMSILYSCIIELWFLPLISFAYIFGITMVSRNEVHGGNKKTLYKCGLIYLMVIASIMLLNFRDGYSLAMATPFLILLIAFIFPVLLSAINNQNPKNIKNVVKTGVISLVILNASFSAGFAGWKYGLAVLVLLPISMLISKQFEVT